MDIYKLAEHLREKVRDEGKIRHCDIAASGHGYLIVDLLDMRDVALFPMDSHPGTY